MTTRTPRHDGDDEDEKKQQKKKSAQPSTLKPQDTNVLPDDIGERIGEGHDEIEDQML